MVNVISFVMYAIIRLCNSSRNELAGMIYHLEWRTLFLYCVSFLKDLQRLILFLFPFLLQEDVSLSFSYTDHNRPLYNYSHLSLI